MCTPLIINFKSCKSFAKKFVFWLTKMVDQVFELLIPSDYNLNLMLGSQTLSHITCKVIDGLKKYLLMKNQFSNCTNTTSHFHALSFYQNIPIVMLAG